MRKFIVVLQIKSRFKQSYKKVKEEEKRSKRQNIVISAAALSAVAVFGIILTL